MADIDGDGHLDLLSGSWPGEIFLFRGGPGRTFAAPEMLKDKTGEFINPGGGIQKDDGQGMLLIAGNATFKKGEDGKQYIEYHGQRIDTKDRQVGITGTASSLHVCDWDHDGDLDLLVGVIGGQVWLVPNEGTKTEYAFGKEKPLEAGGEPIRVHGDAGPVVADWDGDGRPDLLVGDGEGGVLFFRNTGKRGEPKLEKGVALVKGPENGWETSDEPHRGVRAKVCVADWDGDGRLDLLLGDFSQQKAVQPNLTEAEKGEHGKLRAELEQIEPKFRAIITKLYSEDRKEPLPKAEQEKLKKEMEELQKRMMEVHGKLPPETEPHGWVWLYRRKPAGSP